MNDKDFLQLAVEEGALGSRYPFGAIVVLDGQIISRAHNTVWETHDPTKHAEATAIVEACRKLGIHNLPPETTLYSSHEPCLMCFTCAAWAKVQRLVFAVPANEIKGDMFEFDNVNIYEMAERLRRPMKVERIDL